MRVMHVYRVFAKEEMRHSILLKCCEMQIQPTGSKPTPLQRAKQVAEAGAVAFEVPQGAVHAQEPSPEDHEASHLQAWNADRFTLGQIPEVAPPPDVC
jgi:hypothetical protein